MENCINCFLPVVSVEHAKIMVERLRGESMLNEVFLLSTTDCKVDGCTTITVNDFTSTETLRAVAKHATTTYSLLVTKLTDVMLGSNALCRFQQIANDTDAEMLFSDYFTSSNGAIALHPTIDYQRGSLRDDFDFGSVWFFRSDLLKNYLPKAATDYTFAGLYAFRLHWGHFAKVNHVNEPLYTEIETDLRKSGEKQFDYLLGKHREAQIEMEKACTEHLKTIGGWLPERTTPVVFEGNFPVEASVIIPVRNRAKTITDAIRSVLAQETKFDFNVIVVDNHSTDGTSEAIETLAKENNKVVHLVPERNDLGIGGCWNLGVNSAVCGRFAVQLDSDDVYSSPQTLQRIVDEFHKQKCAMVIGSYTLTDEDMNILPPGLIDHKEWTDDNGHNNALRVNGLGAPRAFFTPVFRAIQMPNTSYGEDYMMGLSICRNYRIGRIFDSLYFCRRWSGNSDAALTTEQINRNNKYKDWIRTNELEARIRMNQK